MLSTKIRTAAAVLTAAFAVGTVAGPVMTGDAQAVSKAGTGSQIKPVTKKGLVSQLTSKPTGDAQLDEYCRKVTDLVHRAFREAFAADLAGDSEGAVAWNNLAIEMITRAQANGCKFSITTVRLAQSKTRIPRGAVNTVR